MSSVFSKPKVVQIEPEEVEPEVVDNSEEVQELERKRKKKMGAVSQLLSHDNSYGSGGKTTLGELLQNVYGCPVFHMDDFFLRPEQRTEARFAQPGGNVDRERFLEEVLIPLREGRPVDYRRFDCATFTIAPPQRIKAGTLNIVEGAYSMHPDLAPYYDLSVFLPISAEKQRERILKRNAPAHAKQFFDRWIPFEQRYFDALDVRNRCDLILSADG